MFDVYQELLEYIHTRFSPLRPDNPALAKSSMTTAELDAQHLGVKRVPSELERRFFDILYLIVADWWLVPSPEQWVEIMAQIGCFHPESELNQDTPLRDTLNFFTKAAQLLGFEHLLKL